MTDQARWPAGGRREWRAALRGRTAGIGVPGPKMPAAPACVQEVVVLRRNHAADEDDDVVARPARFSASISCRHQRLVAGGQRRNADGMHVVLDGLARGFLRRLEQRADVDVEAEVGEGRGDDLGAAVVAVLAELGDHDARAAAFGGGEVLDLRREFRPWSASSPKAAP